MSDMQIDVSVYMLTYFHERYVRQAIESVLMQKTHYTFELVISDDNSQDGTVEILKEYEKNYPQKIRVNYNNENLGISRNMYKVRTMCRGKYIVVLSGDDYWIDKNKIERQANFLEQHPKYFSVFNVVELRIDDAKTPYASIPAPGSRNRRYTIKDYEKGRSLGTHGFMMRNVFLTEKGRSYFHRSQEISQFVDDAVDMVLILKKGPAYVLDAATDVHRVIRVDEERKNYNSKYSKLERFRHQIELYNALDRIFGSKIDFSWWYADCCAIGFLGMLLTRDFKGYIKIFQTIPKKYTRLTGKNVYFRLVPNIIRILYTRVKNKL